MKSLLIITVSIFSLSLLSCNSDDEGNNPSPASGANTDVCIGSGSSNSYFPNLNGDKLTYELGPFGEARIEVGGNVTIEGKTYLVSTVASGFGLDTSYFRVGSDGFTYSRDPGDSIEIKEFDYTNLSVGDYYIAYDGDSNVVVDLDASFITPVCNYTGLVKIKDIDSDDPNRLNFDYYKRGIGNVGNECSGDCGIISTLVYLKSMELK